MKNCFAFLAILICFYFAQVTLAEAPRAIDSRDIAVMINATVTKTPAPKITLTWSRNELARQYVINKKAAGEKTWASTIATLDSSINTYTDEDVVPGQAYEYEIQALSKGSAWFQVQKGNQYVDTLIAVDFLAFGYISSGIEVNAYDNPGKVLILLDRTMAEPLKNEIKRLKDDLMAEGWTVIIKNAPRAEKFNTDSVAATKALIVDEYYKKDIGLTSVMIIGRVPVPYSGNLNPDGHPDHLGAWPADVYYGCINTDIWSDYQVVNGGASRDENKNAYGDGKFDQSNLNGMPADLQVGRIDFYNMPKFNYSETELLRKYLDKDHAYRTGAISYQYKALVDDNFNAAGLPEAFASSGWRNLGTLVGRDNVSSSDWFTTLQTNKYLWAYGCGGGWYQGAGGIGTDSNFAATKVNAIFTMLFGSYFGDWDSPNNFMRSALASEPSILTCAWAGRPGWFFHHMGIGYPIGYSAKLTQSNVNEYKAAAYYLGGSQPTLYTIGLNGVHVALMGDPTLKMYMGTEEEPLPQPVSVSVIQPAGKDIEISWKAPSTAVAGYNVYRSAKGKDEDYQPWQKLNDKMITETSYTDKDFRYDGSVNYMVRSIKLQESLSGTFYNPGRGVIKDILATGVEDGQQIPFSFTCTPNPAVDHVDMNLSVPEAGNVSINIYDMKGRLVSHVATADLAQGTHQFSWNLLNNSGSRVEAGVYAIRLNAGERAETVKVVVLP